MDLSESRVRPHGVPGVPQWCRLGVIHRALGGLICAGVLSGVFRVAQPEHRRDTLRTLMPFLWTSVVITGVLQVFCTRPCCVAAEALRRMLSLACLPSPGVRGQRCPAGVPAGT